MPSILSSARTALAVALCACPLLARAEPLRVAVSSGTLAYGGLRIAEGAGLFRQHGFDLAVSVMESGNAAITAVLSGSVEISASGPGEVLAARARGQKIVILANLYRGLSGSLVLSKAAAERAGIPSTADVTAKLKAIDGLTVATPSATSAYTHPYRSAAGAVGAKPRFVYMAQPAMPAALAAGAVQGIIAGAPFSTVPQTDGSGVLWISGPHRGLPAADLPSSSACLQASEEFVRSHPDVVRRLRAALDDLSRLIREEPDRARSYLAKAYPQVAPEALKRIFDDEWENWAQPVMSPADIAQEIAIQKETGALPGLDAIRPEALLAPAGPT